MVPAKARVLWGNDGTKEGSGWVMGMCRDSRQEGRWAAGWLCQLEGASLAGHWVLGERVQYHPEALQVQRHQRGAGEVEEGKTGTPCGHTWVEL